MNFKAATCPQCSGALQIPDDREMIKCMYCGSDISVRNSINSAEKNINNLLFLAKTAKDGGNYLEAYTLFSRILESNPENVEAWLGKGFCAGMQSNLIALRFDELMICYDTALGFCNEDAMISKIKTDCALDIAFIGLAAYELSSSHKLQFISVDSAVYDHADRCKKIIELCEYALTLDSSLEDIRKFISNVASGQAGTMFLDKETRSYFSAKEQEHKVSVYTEPSKESKVVKEGTPIEKAGVLLLIISWPTIIYIIFKLLNSDAVGLGWIISGIISFVAGNYIFVAIAKVYDKLKK